MKRFIGFFNPHIMTAEQIYEKVKQRLEEIKNIEEKEKKPSQKNSK